MTRNIKVGCIYWVSVEAGWYISCIPSKYSVVLERSKKWVLYFECRDVKPESYKTLRAAMVAADKYDKRMIWKALRVVLNRAEQYVPLQEVVREGRSVLNER